MMIKLDSKKCSQFEFASKSEWLETNGIGGYASSSVSGANTRRYHGLLVAATRPPLGRMVLLSKFEETVLVNGTAYELGSNQYPGKVHPEGYKFLKSFVLNPFPVWTYEVDGLKLERKLFMVYGEDTTVITWSVKGPKKNRPKIELELKPLLAFRDHHHLRGVDEAFGGDYKVEENCVSIAPYAEMPGLFLSHNAGSVVPQGYWYRDFEYAIEQERGFDFHEDLYQPFSMKFDLSSDAVVFASTMPKDISDVKKLEIAELERRGFMIGQSGASDDFASQLVLAADQFIVSRGDGKTVIAGYHWFSDWGRDTMIALNGLTLATNRPDIARSILLEFSNHISDGMLPNRFPDAGETPEYNTVDATLWYFEAIRAYVEKTGDYDTIRNHLYEKLLNIIEWHQSGTRYRIHVDADGLLYSGEPGVQLTWMDAKIGDWVVTPRTGKAVEIQALWYNALCIMSDLAERFDDTKTRDRFAKMAKLAHESFNNQFWNEDENCLFDVINGDEKDGSVRPNQIFAVSLPFSIVAPERARVVVDKVESELLTPFGLRSLSPKDPSYIPVYIGSPLERDAGYHQGTVWSWLIGAFVDAYRSVHAGEKGLDKRVNEILSGFKSHLLDAGIGQISEIFDADASNLPRGCMAQAWSVAEVLRVSQIKVK